MSRAKNKRSISIKTTIVTIVALICLVVGAISIIKWSFKIISTGIDLISYSLSAQDYNENHWSNELEVAQKIDNQKRQELYNSQDNTVRVYANLPAVIKILGLIFAIALIPSVIYYGIIAIINILLFYKKKMLIGKAKFYKAKYTNLEYLKNSGR